MRGKEGVCISSECIGKVHNLSRSPTRLLFVAFIHKSHSDGQSRSDGQKMKKIHVNKALGPPLATATKDEEQRELIAENKKLLEEIARLYNDKEEEDSSDEDTIEVYPVQPLLKRKRMM